MNLPNKLTVLRIILIPFLLFFLLFETVPNRYIYALIIFILASFTDYLDGKIARGNNIITDFGKFADPLADKCLVISAFICFIRSGLVSPLAVILIILREFTVTSVRLMAVKSGKVISANLWGKAKTISQMLAILCLIVSKAINEVILINGNLYNFSAYNDILFTLCNILVWISVILSLVSGYMYIYLNKQFIESSK